MRRRLLLVALWLAGTAGATAVVSTAVSRLSTDLTSVNQQFVQAPTGGNADDTTTTTSGSLVSVEPVAQPTTVVEAPVPVETTAPPETTVPEPVVVVDTTAPRPATTTPRVTSAPVPTNPTVPVDPPVTTPTTPPTTAAPPPPPTAPATTAPPPPPPPTTPPVSCYPAAKRVGQSGTVDYNVCGDGVRLIRAQAVGSWVLTVVSSGPPSVSVRFTQGSQVVACTIGSDGDGGVATTGSC